MRERGERGERVVRGLRETREVREIGKSRESENMNKNHLAFYVMVSWYPWDQGS